MTLRMTDGAILFDNGALAMSEACCCDNCDNCCTGFTPPSDIILDLGVGGLTEGLLCDDSILSCNDLAGEITLGELVSPECEWSRFFISPFCNILKIGYQTRFFLELLVVSGNTCFYRLTITMSDNNDESVVNGVAIYETASKTFVENDCTLASPVTLAKISEDWDDWCVGTLPANITIEAAP